MMSSRSVIWTLTQPVIPGPADGIRQQLGDTLQNNLPKRSRHLNLGNLRAAAAPDRLFAGEPVEDLLPAAAPNDYPDPLLRVLVAMDPMAGERRRPGRAPVRQEIDAEFVNAALSQWARNDTTGMRIDLLHNSDVLDRLVQKGFLTDEMRQELHEPGDRWPRPVIPPDFCDDGKNGRDLGLRSELQHARKVCYGLFREPQLPESALDATDPELWHRRCPQFWVRSDVVVTAEGQDGNCEYRAGVLTEMVNLPNHLRTFGPVTLTFVRTTANDKTWSMVTYKLVDQDAVKVDEGWYLVQRRDDSANAAIMVKLIEFHRGNDWLDAVCETGLLDGARVLLDGDQGAAETSRTTREPAATGAGQDGVLTGVLSGYLDERRREWDDLARQGVEEVKRGIAEFESRPLRFGWVDNVFGVIDRSTSFLSSAASSWADVVQQDLPQALARAESATADRATTPAHLVAAGWKAALGLFKVGSDVSRAMLQVTGPGFGESGTAILDGLTDLERSGRLAAFLRSCGVTDIGTAKQKLFNNAPRAHSATEFAADLDTVLRTFGNRNRLPDSDKRTKFVDEVLATGQPRGGQAGR